MLFYRGAQIRQPFLIRLPTSQSLSQGIFISARFHEYAAGTEVVGDNSNNGLAGIGSVDGKIL